MPRETARPPHTMRYHRLRLRHGQSTTLVNPLQTSIVLEYLGNGPQATGGAGWSLGPEHLLRCIGCGDFITIPAKGPSGQKACGCGALCFDIGRFGSSFGDASVEVYRLKPLRP